MRALIALALLLVPLGAASVSTSTAAPPRYIDVVRYAFVDRTSGDELTVVPAGTVVTWVFSPQPVGVWFRAMSSRTLSTSGLDAFRFDSGDIPPSGEEVTRSFGFYSAGVYTYYCPYHAQMKGYVVVQP